MIESIKGLILDMDGVLWRGNDPICDLELLFSKLKSQGVKYTFATNNSTKTIEQYHQKLTSYGIEVTEDQIFTSAIVTANILSDRFPERADLFVIGEKGLITELESHGFSIDGNDPIGVVVGLDRSITYKKLSRATQLVQSGCWFVGTNPDKSLPTPTGFAPGTGSLLALIETATGVKSEIFGKPNKEIFTMAYNYLGLPHQEVMVVGDRLDTDISGGIQAGLKTTLVMSGVTDQTTLSKSTIQPDLVFPDIQALVEKIN